MSKKAGLLLSKTYEGQGNWDTTYKSVEIKKKLVPLGDADENGEIPYTEEVVEIVTETPIRDVLDAQKDSCGLEAYLKPYRLQGIEPPDVNVSCDVQDFTAFDDAGDLRVSGKVDELYYSLPQDLRDKYGSPEKLLRDISDAAIAEYVESKLKSEEKKEEKKDE